jgi:hypothetical protein
MKRILLLIVIMIPLHGICQAKSRNTSSIDSTVAYIKKISKGTGESFTIEKTITGKKTKETWNYYNAKGLGFISIEYKIDSTAYAERYFLENGSLIYAYESEILYFPSLNDQSAWAGDFYFSKNKLIHHVTLGHGKSEMDDWDPEKEILQRLKERKEELSLLK